jgi:heparanase 1
LVIEGETSSGWGGGTKGISNTFAGTFMWLDKVGNAALGKIDVVMRQSLLVGWYALIDRDLNPTPVIGHWPLNGIGFVTTATI